jgi:hypothetical protein
MESTIDIISVGGTTNTVVIGQGSVRHYELMSSDYVRLVFSTDKKINIRIGDHIVTKEWGTFYITKLQRPTYNKSTGGFDYDLQFDAPYYLWNNRLYKYDPKNNRNEASWSLTDNLKNHMAVFLRSLSYYGWTYTVDAASYSLEEAQRTVYISFQNKYLLDALSQIAESFNLEYWITDNIIHFGKAESGTAIDFKLGDNVEEMSAENSESDGANRFYAFGSTQNIPSGYRSSESEVILNGVVQNRLMLPKDTPYIDLDSGLKTEEVVDGIVTFDDVYPRTKSSVSEVIKVSKTVEKSNTVEATTDTSAVTDDSKAETEVVNIYRFKTSDFNFSADYILANTSLQVQFVSGKLNGMTFEVAFNPNGENEKTIVDGKTVVNPDSQLFELVRNDTYGLTLPNDTLCPAVGDKFVLLGWDANKLTAWKELITKAEEELKSKLEAYVAKKRIDPLTYVCTMMSDYMYGLDANGKQDPNFSKVGSFPIGQAIRLHSDVYFKDGMRESRVIGYEYKLDLPFDAAQIYVGESPIYSNSKATQNAINEATNTIINYRGGNYSNEGTGSGNLFVISSADTITAPSDNNVFSAKRSDLDFAHKRKDDRISSLWTFTNGYGARRGLQTYEYRNKVNEDNLFGSGFELIERTTNNGGKRSRLEVDELLVRVKAFFAELEIRKISYVGGNYLFSSAGGKIYYVEWLDANGVVLDKSSHQASEAYTFRCYLYSDNGTTATMNYFAADDQVICKTFNIDEEVHKNVSNKYWWRRATGTGKGSIAALSDKTEYQYVDISMNDCDEKSDYPEENDTIVQLGNWTNSARQGAIYLMVEGESAPAIMEYSDLGANGKHFMLTKPTLQLSPKGNIIYGEFHSVNDTTTYPDGKSIDEMIEDLMKQIAEIQAQADKKFDIYFEGGAPHPLKGEDFSTANYPANEWTTHALKELHVQDLYYDTDIAPASDGGRAWRWVSESTTGTDGSTTKTYYWEMVTDQDTISALEKARDLQNQVDDIVSDGVISKGSEKSDLLIEWHKAASNYEKYREQADDYSLLNDDVWKKYHDAFFTVATMLNNGTTYIEKNRTDGVIPAWLDVTVDTVLADTPTKNAATYRNTWNDYYTTFAAVLKLISGKAKELADNAQKSADEANGAIDDIVSDGRLDPSEKITIKRDFLAFYHELTDDNGLKDKGQDENDKFYTDGIETAYDKVIGCFNEVGTLLNGSVSWALGAVLDEDTLPVWLRNPPTVLTSTDKNEYITVTSTIKADEFRSKWSAMYAAKSAYIALLSEYAKGLADNAQKSADEKVQTFVTEKVPDPPYKKGDMWIQTGNGNNVMISLADRESGDTTSSLERLKDWTDLSELSTKQDPRIQLAMLGDKIYELSGGYIQNNGKISIVFSANQPASATDGDLWFDGEKLKRYVSSWEEIKTDSYVRAFKTVFDIVGQQTLTCFSSVQTQNMKLYDLVLRNTEWHDPFKDETVYGNVEVLMYNGKRWETLKECTRAIIDNLGDELRLVVFGSDGKGATDASGLITRTMFNELFSEHVSDDGLVTRASIKTVIEFDDDGNATGIVSIDADKINFIGKTIINGNFVVDTDGNLTLNHLTADNADITGKVTANTGTIGGFTIGYDGLYSGSWDTSKATTISDAWFDTDNKESICYLSPSALWLEQQVGYFAAGDVAYMQVGLGRGSDPTSKGSEAGYCASAMYIKRQMNSNPTEASYYYPAGQIISDNVINRNVALRLVGGLQVHGGVMEKGYSLSYTKSGDTNILDLSFGTIFLLHTSVAPTTSGNTRTYAAFFFPTLTELRHQLGITSTSESFAVRVIIISRKDTEDYMICTQKSNSSVSASEAGILADNNGNEWHSSKNVMGKGDCSIYCLCYTPTTGYYAQLITDFS